MPTAPKKTWGGQWFPQVRSSWLPLSRADRKLLRKAPCFLAAKRCQQYRLTRMLRLSINIMSFLILVLCVILNSSVLGQPKDIKIRYLGNAGLYITDGNLNLYVDFPYKSGAFGYMEYDKSILDSIKPNSHFLFTHGHADHYSRKLFKKTNGELYGPWPVRFLLSKERQFKLEEFNRTFEHITIEKYKARHSWCLQHFSYLITWRNKKIYISGDAENADIIARMKDLNIAFVPYWLLYDASEKSIKIDSKKIVLYHLYPDQKVENPQKLTIPKQNKVFVLKY